MNAPDASPIEVGRQLARRREDLDLTQEELGQRAGIAARTVSAIERGLNTISRSKRPAWEQALELKPGTITRAYRDGTPIEPVEPEVAPQDAEPDPLAGLPADPDERLEELHRRLEENARRQQALLEEMRRLAVERPNSVKPVDRREA